MKHEVFGWCVFVGVPIIHRGIGDPPIKYPSKTNSNLVAHGKRRGEERERERMREEMRSETMTKK